MMVTGWVEGQVEIVIVLNFSSRFKLLFSFSKNCHTDELINIQGRPSNKTVWHITSINDIASLSVSVSSSVCSCPIVDKNGKKIFVDLIKYSLNVIYWFMDGMVGMMAKQISVKKFSENKNRSFGRRKSRSLNFFDRIFLYFRAARERLNY